ncbi:3-hydroxybutyrate dehydrogenase [Raphidocelis subcapitata]|uniref:3-oxoacyl-[acyl-carrier-protein] reductase n=1 Tax=Raphidocelis subcapitata TaxID=307507 RepID=A0A2V0PI18_9CHLO|nr:3-hydroxybutyrate dehydrogenase [Raphidocelis subcapitata]|eukprot:GBF99376.1 3-hydroxybutyrate dehydrogenase [Raphidocelis subcapitata]
MTLGVSLAGKVALVTGSTSGIGLAMIRALAGAGADVALHGFGDHATIASLQDQLRSEHQVNVFYSDADLRQPSQIKRLVDSVADKLGGVHIVCNNAGIQHVSPVESFPEDKWDDIIAVCLSSTFHTTKAAVPYMLKHGWGRIINTGSMHALVASPYKSAYNAAKHGVAGFTKTVALELARKNITCNAICPGYVLTDLVRNQLKDTAMARGIPEEQVINEVMLADQPTRQFVKPEDLAAMVLHLCGPHSSSITGACISVDGGWTAR